MARRAAFTGNGAFAEAMRQVEPDLVAAYPITPQTEVVEEFSQTVADGRVSTQFVPVESEHSAMSACIGGAAAGGRVMTSTASQGLAYMWEMLGIASGLRLPIVMGVANRALSAPINIHGDHSDAMGARDSGWVQIYCKNPQEVYDTVIQAVRISERKSVRLPVMVCYDGFTVSHSLMDLEVLDDGAVKGFIGEYEAEAPLLDVDNPVSWGGLDLYDYYFEHKRQQVEGVENALEAVKMVGVEFGDLFGRNYGLIEPYKVEDAEVVAVLLGATASTAEYEVDILRSKGLKAGILRVRCFRPFPKEEIVEALAGAFAVAVMDRAESFSRWGGPVSIEIRAALYDEGKRPALLPVVYGLGGRDVTAVHIGEVFEILEKIKGSGQTQEVVYLGLRE
ncbi:MAG: pyruvate ferredoxin oxidoreductase [Candidatus Aquicultorales bacterium]